ncbi:MAG: hypothetical protein ACYDEV_10905 [Acidiferrobacter sp.]
MISTLPVILRPLAPRARFVPLRPYTSLGAVVVPNLGLRLLFPRSDASALTFALTNPLFKAARLGPSGLLITVARGSHRRYCGNVFIGLQRYAVSLLLCTTMTASHYVSDIVFTNPKRPAPPIPMSAVKPPVWQVALADIAFGHNAQIDITKRVALSRSGPADTLSVSRFLLTPGQAILGFVVAGPKDSVPKVTGASLYRGRKDWRRVPGVVACDKADSAHQTRCALVIARPARTVSRWHLVVVTPFGATRLSW